MNAPFLPAIDKIWLHQNGTHTYTNNMVHAGIFFSLSQKSTVQSHNNKITTKAALSSTMGNHQNQIFVYSSPTTHTLTCKIRIMHRRIGNSIPNFRIQEHIVRHTHTHTPTATPSNIEIKFSIWVYYHTLRIMQDWDQSHITPEKNGADQKKKLRRAHINKYYL